MNLGALLLVALSLGLSNFAAAIGIGLGHLSTASRIKTGLAFGFFEALMPILGLLLGQSVAGRLGEIGRYAGGALLVLTGLYAFWKARRDARRNEPAHSEALDNPKLLITAFAISLDNLVVGFALSFSRTPILLAAAIIAAVSVGMSMVGLELGDRLGGRVGEWSEEIGAGVLVLVGVAIAAGLFR